MKFAFRRLWQNRLNLVHRPVLLSVQLSNAPRPTDHPTAAIAVWCVCLWALQFSVPPRRSIQRRDECASGVYVFVYLNNACNIAGDRNAWCQRWRQKKKKQKKNETNEVANCTHFVTLMCTDFNYCRNVIREQNKSRNNGFPVNDARPLFGLSAGRTERKKKKKKKEEILGLQYIVWTVIRLARKGEPTIIMVDIVYRTAYGYFVRKYTPDTIRKCSITKYKTTLLLEFHCPGAQEKKKKNPIHIQNLT